jgi:His-Xaa-Ser system radical SAM maturase HxsC
VRLHSFGTAQEVFTPVIGKLTAIPRLATETREDYIAFGAGAELAAFRDDWTGYAGMLSLDPPSSAPLISLPRVYGPPHLEYLRGGDVVQLHPSGLVEVLYRRSSPHNTILTTERCNSFCLMCSQPPKDKDASHRVGQILRLLELVDPHTIELGLSGGEPTLLGDSFLAIIEKAKRLLPTTALHVLTNGRQFKDAAFAQQLAATGHHDLMLGIPLYSDIDSFHDYVVQARGAFDQTMEGFYNLAKVGLRLELRVVLHKQTYSRLPKLAEFICRNLAFVEHVALMGLEMFGFTPKNLDVLWIDPVDYQAELEEATLCLAGHGMNVSIYNHQLCTIPRSLWPFARKSISDWKNVYLEGCDGCSLRPYCGGFFQSGTKRHSGHIQPLKELSRTAESFMRSLHGVESLVV